MPLVRVVRRVEPTVSVPPRAKVPPTPSKVNGQSTVNPPDVMVCVPEVPANVQALVPAV